MMRGDARSGHDAFIHCEGIWKIFSPGKLHEVCALVDVTLTVGKGSFTLFHGPSGSGKTTLIGLLGTMDRPSRGRIHIEGRDTTAFSDVARCRFRRRRVGFVFQAFHLIEKFSAWENVAVPLVPLDLTHRERRRKALELLDRLGLSDRADHLPGELSGGEQQRVAMARALINNPDILILDEPTSNIDAETVASVMELLGELKAEGKTIIASSHDRDLVQSADRVFELRRGSLFPPGGAP